MPQAESDKAMSRQLDDAQRALSIAIKPACGIAVWLACESEDVRTELETILLEKIEEYGDDQAVLDVFQTVFEAVITHGTVDSLLRRASPH